MKIKCAWCGGDMGHKAGPKDAVTHGICPPCRGRYFPGLTSERDLEPVVAFLSGELLLALVVCWGLLAHRWLA